jgi:AAA family ATPase, CDC48 subfamily
LPYVFHLNKAKVKIQYLSGVFFLPRAEDRRRMYEINERHSVAMEDSIELKVGMGTNPSEAGFGRARMDSVSRNRLGLEIGDVVEIIGKKSVAAKVFKGDRDDEGKGILRIDGITRTNAGVSPDENVKVRKSKVVEAEKVTLAPNIPADKKMRLEPGMEDLFKSGLMNRPVMKGNDVIIPNIALMGSRSTFTVQNTAPAGIVVIGPKTTVIVNETSKITEEKYILGQITYDDVGGLEEELKKIREMIELPLKHPELFERLGISAPKGILLFGPPGTGKTLIAKAVANESGASFFAIQGPEIFNRYYGQSEEKLREIFQNAQEKAPSIVFLDEIDSIAPNRDQVHGDVEKRIVAQLLTLMDGLSGRGDVIVIGATNRENGIDPALRRPGRFDREIEIGVPGRKGRGDILSVHLRGMPLSADVSTDTLAGMTHGFVGADLAALGREAAMKCLRRKMPELDLDKPIPQAVLENMRVTMEDFMSALGEVEPSGMREVLVEIPKVKWSDVGGLDDIKKELQEVFIPSEDPKAFERLGIRPAKGVLFYGPPGTGKTLIAKAVANESGVNFISVNGPEIANKWFGESEKAIRQIFKRAKQMSPCIIFFDELDSIAPRRGRNNDTNWEKVVNQLLTSMDGVESLKNVMIVAATNRPDMIDPALLRPGRFDKLIYIGPPDTDGRLKILEVHTKNMPLIKVDLKKLAQGTEGFVGADIEALCREAGLAAYREDPKAEMVKEKHFMAALKEVTASVSENDLKQYESAGKEIRKRRASWDDIPFYQ